MPRMAGNQSQTKFFHKHPGEIDGQSKEVGISQMEDSQHAADDGEAQGDEQVKRPEDKRVNEDDLEGIPHGSVTPSSEVLKNRQIDSSAFSEPNQTVFYNKRENFASLL